MSFNDPNRPQMALDDALVRRFIDAFAALRPLVTRLQSGADPTSDLERAFERDQRARAQVTALLARHGFASMEAWSDAVFAVTIALTYADPTSGAERMEEELREAARAIEADAEVSEAEKAEALAAIRGDLETMLRMRPGAGNIAAVRPHVERLRTLLGQP